MRPNNQNKNRSRGRGSGRKHQNPLSRTYESNGPDVKVRGNAAHVAEKYVQLARDAQASGDMVIAENYLQHAEHYFRIISAAQAQTAARNEAQNASDSNEDDREDGNETAAPAAQSNGAKAEPAESEPAESEAQPNAAESEAAGSGEDKEKPRARRPRRRKVSETQDAAEGGDPANAPQPEVGELPAFLTSGNSTNAAE